MRHTNILQNIYADMFCYTNPIPIKYAVYNKMYKLGKWSKDDLEDYLIREPLVKLPESTLEAVSIPCDTLALNTTEPI